MAKYISPDILFDMVLARFPDMVDIVQVDSLDFGEIVADVPQEIFDAHKDDVTSYDITQYTRHLPIHMTEELEPETEIYAYMSPITHRVFVYKKPDVDFYTDFPEDYNPRCVR